MTPETALVLYGIYLAFAFGHRTFAHYRRTGSTGFNGISGTAGSTEWWTGVAFVLALLIGLAAPLLAILGTSERIQALDHPEIQIVGVVIFTLGFFGTLLSQEAMGASWRIGVDRSEQTPLVASGPFALSRNPIFTSMLTAAIGLALVVGNAPALVGVICLLVALELQTRVVEEPYLIATHGDDYRRYASRVGRFTPSIGRLATPPQERSARQSR